MSLLKKLQQGNAPTHAPSTPAPNAYITTAVHGIEAVRAIVPDAPVGAGVITTVERAAVAINPPDATVSAPPTSAAPIPAEEKLTLSPELAAVAKEWDPPAVETVTAIGEDGSSTPKSGPLIAAAPVVKKRGPGRPKATVVTVSGTDNTVHTTETAPATATENIVTAAEVNAAPSAPAPLCLYVDVVGTGISCRDLTPYVNGICSQLAQQFGAADIRCAPNDSPLGFGKWKGALAAIVRASLPTPGNYFLNFTAGNEVFAVVIDALIPYCATVLRGI